MVVHTKKTRHYGQKGENNGTGLNLNKLNLSESLG